MKTTIKKTMGALALLFAAPAAWALTPAQVTALKATCLADATCAALANAADDVAMAAWFNAPDASWWVWKPQVTDREIMADAAFDWTRVDNLSVGKSRIWDWMFRFGYIDPANANVRAGIDAAWVGTAADLAVRAAVYAKCKRNPSRAERALATGTGTVASPGTLTLVGDITYADASLIRS